MAAAAHVSARAIVCENGGEGGGRKEITGEKAVKK